MHQVPFCLYTALFFFAQIQLFTTQSLLLTTLKKEAFENNSGKRRKCWYFLLFPKMFSILYKKKFQFFKSHLICPLQKLSIWTGLKFCRLIKSSLFTTQSRLLMTLQKKSYKNTVGKGENAAYQHFLLFPQCFLLHHTDKSSF